MTKRPEEVYDDSGRLIRPAFLDRDNHLTIFRDHLGRRKYIERNNYVSKESLWQAARLPDCRDVVVRDGDHNFWEVVPDAEAATLRDGIYPAHA